MTDEKIQVLVELTGAEILDLAEFAGLKVAPRSQQGADELETPVNVAKYPGGGIADDDGRPIKPTRYMAYLAEYPDEGCVQIGEPGVK